MHIKDHLAESIFKGAVREVQSAFAISGYHSKIWGRFEESLFLKEEFI